MTRKSSFCLKISFYSMSLRKSLMLKKSVIATGKSAVRAGLDSVLVHLSKVLLKMLKSNPCIWVSPDHCWKDLSWVDVNNGQRSCDPKLSNHGKDCFHDEESCRNVKEDEKQEESPEKGKKKISANWLLGMKMVSRHAEPPTARNASWEILRERLRVNRVMVRAGISTRPKIICVK